MIAILKILSLNVSLGAGAKAIKLESGETDIISRYFVEKTGSGKKDREGSDKTELASYSSWDKLQH